MEHTIALEKALAGAGFDVLVDDRDQRPGVKFKDADLIGVPLRIVVGERVSFANLKAKRLSIGQLLPVGPQTDDGRKDFLKG